MILKVYEVCRRLGPVEFYACESLQKLASIVHNTFGDEGQYTSEVTQITEVYQKVILVGFEENIKSKMEKSVDA